MKTPMPIMFLMLLSFLTLSNSFAEESIVDAVKITDDAGVVAVDGEFDRKDYYTFRPDLRLCVSPLCGGFFVKSVNQLLTRCADGSLQAECYVASLKNRRNLDMSSARLVQGTVRAKNYDGFGNLGVFVVKAAFSQATEAALGAAFFVGLENNGIVCITTPCFSIDQYVLNRRKIRAISDIDLRKSGASDALVNEGLSMIAKGGVLIASGVNQQTEEPTGKGIVFVADQFYLPVGTIN